jgi:molybdate-binding protein/DNA-binding XRE family transcriptional regulator
MAAFLDVTLRSARVEARLSQGELAAMAGVTRQAIGAIESGKTAPTLSVALRLARALGRSVDELFRLVDELPTTRALVAGSSGPSALGARVFAAEIDGQVVARPLVGSSGAVLALPRANGLLADLAADVGTDASGTVELLGDPDGLGRSVVAVGCDPATSILADHLHRRHPRFELAWFGGNSLQALRSVARGEAHVAGCHLLDVASGEYNAPFARRVLGDDVSLVSFAMWEQGLLVVPGNPLSIRDAADLARQDVRLANREQGSGARALLDQRLAEGAIPASRVRGYTAIVHSHLAAAEAVAAGLADCAVGVRAAAQALGLGFVPWARERYDLVVPSRYLDLAPIQALLETLTSPLFRLEIEALGGYDVSPMGQLTSLAA